MESGAVDPVKGADGVTKKKKSLDNTLISDGLKCAVCWEYLTDPHTLPCGHTFCLGCLQVLAATARVSRTHAPLDRIRFNCPTCRRKTLARPILRQKAAVNYAVKEMVDSWLESPFARGTLVVTVFRTLAVQTTESCFTDSANHHETNVPCTSTNHTTTDVSKHKPQSSSLENNAQDESERNEANVQTESCKSSNQTHEIPASVNKDPSPDLGQDDVGTNVPETVHDDSTSESITAPYFHRLLYHCQDGRWTPKNRNRTRANAPARDATPLLTRLPPNEIVVSTSSDESTSEQEMPYGVEYIRVVEENNANERRDRWYDITSAADVICLFIKQCLRIFRHIRQRPSRMFLTALWFLYCGVIMFVFSACVPWIGLYSVVYFIIIYAELEPIEE